MTYNVFGGTLNLAQSQSLYSHARGVGVTTSPLKGTTLQLSITLYAIFPSLEICSRIFQSRTSSFFAQNITHKSYTNAHARQCMVQRFQHVNAEGNIERRSILRTKAITSAR